MVAGLLALVLGLLGVGVAGGYWFAARHATPSVPALLLEKESSQEEPSTRGTVSLPDVTLMPLADAETALADAGVDLAKVSSSTRPWAGPPGRVVKQQPPRGSTTYDRVALTVSATAQVPRLVGKPRAAAQKALEALGAIVVTQLSYDPKARLGTVLATVPAERAALPERIIVRVAGEPATVYLDALNSTSGSCGVGEETMRGKTYAHSITCSAYSSGRSLGYQLNRQIDRLQAMVWVPAGESAAKVRIVLDGRAVTTFVVQPGGSRPLDVPIRGAAALELAVSSVDPDSRTEVVFGDARLLGATSAVDSLSGG